MTDSELENGREDLLLDAARELLAGALRDRDAQFRYPVLATADRGGGANARTLILRSADTDLWLLTLHTDLRSAKVREIEASGTATLVFFDHASGTQLRLRGEIGALENEAQRQAAWKALPESNRLNYRSLEPPGAQIDSPMKALGPPDDDAEYGNFAVLCFQTATADVLRLSAAGNLRYRLNVASGTGAWLVP